MSILGMMGCDLGMASCTLTKSTFGDKGGRYIVSLIFAINLIGWFGIQNGVCGEAFTNFMSEYAGIEVPLVVSNILWAVSYTHLDSPQRNSAGAGVEIPLSLL